MAGVGVARGAPGPDRPAASIEALWMSVVCLPGGRVILVKDAAQPGYGVRTRIDLAPIEEFRRSLDGGGEAMRCIELIISHSGGYAVAPVVAPVSREHGGSQE